MKIFFRNDDTLVVRACDSVEAMALKYWQKEFSEHGEKLLDVDTDIPIVLEDNS